VRRRRRLDDLDHVDLLGDDARRDAARDRADGAEGQRQSQTDEADADEDRAENGPDLTGVDLDTGGGAVGERAGHDGQLVDEQVDAAADGDERAAHEHPERDAADHTGGVGHGEAPSVTSPHARRHFDYLRTTRGAVMRRL
jgi:hypothetical protein